MRYVEPTRWERYHRLRESGWHVTEAARRSGISRDAAASFERGDPSSSGVRWMEAQAKTGAK